MQFLVPEQEEDEEFLRAELCAGLLVLPDYLTGLFVVFEHGHCDHHCPTHELLNLQVVSHPPLVYRLVLGLLQEEDLEEHAQGL